MSPSGFSPRLAARALDIALALLAHRMVALVVESAWPEVLSYFGYVALVALLGGRSLGKALWRLEVLGPRLRPASWWRLLGREVCLFLLGPLVLLGRQGGRFLNDRMFQTQVFHV